MMTDPNIDFEKLIGAIYEGPLESIPWQSFLDLLRESMDAMTVGLILRPPSAEDKGLLLNEGTINPSWRAAYRDRFFALDPFVDLPLSEPVTLQELVPTEELIQREFYTQYMEPIGAFYALALDIREPNGLEARLRAARSIDGKDFDDADKNLFRKFVPHLQRALQIHSRLQCIESERDLYADAVDQFSVGTILLDEKGAILQMNHVAETLTQEEDGLSVREKTLRTRDQASNRKLKRLIDDALLMQRTKQPSIVEAIRIQRPSGKGQISLLVRPVPIGQWSDGKACPAVAIFIGQPEDNPPISPEIIQQLFSFTKAEAAVATLLVTGLNPEEVAERLGVSVHTARAHIRALYSKTGVSRQTELVLLVLRSAANLG